MGSAKPAAISLFSGAGGLDHGFRAAGFRTAAAVEMDPRCCSTLRANGYRDVIESDIHSVSSEDLLRAAKLQRGEPAVLIGGPPCQPFSKSGYWAHGDSARLDDPRASTLKAYLRIMQDTLPKVILLENVEGLGYLGKSEGIESVLREIRAINRRAGTRYRPSFRVLCAADYGVPQLRHRFFLVAARDGGTFKFPEATHSPRAAEEPQQLLIGHQQFHRTAWDALGDDDPGAEDDLSVRGKWSALLPSIPEGQNYLWHTDRGEGLCLFGWRRRYWNFLLKLAKDRPSSTVQAQPGPATGPFHWESRRLSRRELCRLQTFPDDVRILGSLSDAQRQLGNAVPSLLAEVLAREILVQFLGARPKAATPTLLPPLRGPVPAPERPLPVPASYRVLVGRHPAHPGTGRGYRAKAWSSSDAEADDARS